MLASPRRTYAFSAGPARVVVLDGNDPGDADQTAFLRRELRTAPEPVRIVAFHQPLYTAGIHPPAEDARRVWGPLLRAGRVSLVLQGHNHDYERLEAGGVTYITTGGGRRAALPVRAALEASCAGAWPRTTSSPSPPPRGRSSVRAVPPSGTTLERVRIPVA